MSIKTLFTDKDDNLELASVITFMLVAAFIFFSFYHYFYLGEKFDPQSFGIGAGGIGAGHGAGKMMGNRGDYGGGGGITP